MFLGEEAPDNIEDPGRIWGGGALIAPGFRVF